MVSSFPSKFCAQIKKYNMISRPQEQRNPLWSQVDDPHHADNTAWARYSLTVSVSGGCNLAILRQILDTSSISGVYPQQIHSTCSRDGIIFPSTSSPHHASEFSGCSTLQGIRSSANCRLRAMSVVSSNMTRVMSRYRPWSSQYIFRNFWDSGVSLRRSA